MICPECKAQYDIYNAISINNTWECPECKVELNDSDTQ